MRRRRGLFQSVVFSSGDEAVAGGAPCCTMIRVCLVGAPRIVTDDDVGTHVPDGSRYQIRRRIAVAAQTSIREASQANPGDSEKRGGRFAFDSARGCDEVRIDRRVLRAEPSVGQDEELDVRTCSTPGGDRSTREQFRVVWMRADDERAGRMGHAWRSAAESVSDTTSS